MISGCRVLRYAEYAVFSSKWARCRSVAGFSRVAEDFASSDSMGHLLVGYFSPLRLASITALSSSSSHVLLGGLVADIVGKFGADLREICE